MKKYHRIENVRFEGENLLLTIDGRGKSFPLREVSSSLQKASDKERIAFEVSPSGYGIHWPLLDEDLSVDGLLGISHSPSRKKKLAPTSTFARTP